MEVLGLLERERVRAGLIDRLPGRDAQVKQKIGRQEANDPAPLTAPASSSVSVAIEIEPLLVCRSRHVEGGRSSVPWPIRSTVPLLTKDFAVTESDDERSLLPIESSASPVRG